MPRQFLLKDASVDTVGQEFNGLGTQFRCTVWGNLGGGTIHLEISDDGGSTWVPMTELGVQLYVFTAIQSSDLPAVPPITKIRARLAGSTGASGVNVTLTA